MGQLLPALPDVSWGSCYGGSSGGVLIGASLFSLLSFYVILPDGALACCSSELKKRLLCSKIVLTRRRKRAQGYTNFPPELGGGYSFLGHTDYDEIRKTYEKLIITGSVCVF